MIYILCMTIIGAPYNILKHITESICTDISTLRPSTVSYRTMGDTLPLFPDTKDFHVTDTTVVLVSVYDDK